MTAVVTKCLYHPGSGTDTATLPRNPSENHNHRTTEYQGLEGTSVGHPFQPASRSRVTHSRLHSTLSRRVLNI